VSKGLGNTLAFRFHLERLQPPFLPTFLTSTTLTSQDTPDDFRFLYECTALPEVSGSWSAAVP